MLQLDCEWSQFFLDLIVFGEILERNKNENFKLLQQFVEFLVNFPRKFNVIDLLKLQIANVFVKAQLIPSLSSSLCCYGKSMTLFYFIGQFYFSIFHFPTLSHIAVPAMFNHNKNSIRYDFTTLFYHFCSLPPSNAHSPTECPFQPPHCWTVEHIKKRFSPFSFSFDKSRGSRTCLRLLRVCEPFFGTNRKKGKKILFCLVTCHNENWH